MADMSLTSSGTKKVLSFEEFTAAQQGGMESPMDNEFNNELDITAEPTGDDFSAETPNLDNQDQDDIALLDSPDSTETPEEGDDSIPTEEPETEEPQA